MQKFKHFIEIVPLEENLQLRDNDAILDVGCGSGKILNNLEGKRLFRVGIDIEKSGNIQEQSKVNFVLADACYLPFANISFDIVMSNELVSHVWNLQQSLEEMNRVSKNTVYIKDTNLLNPNIVYNLLVRLGVKWLLRKHLFNRRSKLEDIHSVFWWKKTLPTVTVLSKRRFPNALIDVAWKYFGHDCILRFMPRDN